MGNEINMVFGKLHFGVQPSIWICKCFWENSINHCGQNGEEGVYCPVVLRFTDRLIDKWMKISKHQEIQTVLSGNQERLKDWS